MNPRVIIRSDEAEWSGLSRCWAHVQFYAPRNPLARLAPVLKVCAAFVLGCVAMAMMAVFVGASA